MDLSKLFPDLCGPQIPYAEANGSGWDDAQAGKPITPPDHDLLWPSYLDGYKIGDIEARANRGELIRYISEETYCTACKSYNWGMRLGCRCGGKIEWGVRIQRGPESEYLSIEAATEVLRGKLPVFDMMGDALAIRKTKKGLSIRKRKGKI
jgi:hypothetical protein